MAEATEADRKRIADALESGRVEFAPGLEEALARMDPDQPFALRSVVVDSCWGPFTRTSKDGSIYSNGGGIGIHWVSEHHGTGRVTIYLKDGRTRCENEGMGRESLKAILGRLIDNIELED